MWRISITTFLSILYSTQVLSEFSMPSISSALSGVGGLFEYKPSDLLLNKDGVIAAFGDFNADERVDVFVISNSAQQLDVLLARENKPYDRKTVIHIRNNTIITSVVPMDFNGDLQMDVLLTTRMIGKPNASVTVSIYWGNHSIGELDPVPLVLNETFNDDPLVFDYNQDIYPDLLGEVTAGDRKIWLNTENKSFVMQDFPSPKGENNTHTAFASPQSHAFVDMNGDLSADLVLTTQDGYELWINKDGIYTLMDTYRPPELFSDGFIGQSSFADLDQNSMMDHVLAGCVDKECKHSAISVRTEGKWTQIMKPDDLIHDGVQWNFIPPSLDMYAAYTNQTFLVMLRFSDYDLDGYPDAVVTLRNTSQDGDLQQVFVLHNIACQGECHEYNRTFSILQPTEVVNNAMVATFYDMYEDGKPDIVAVFMSYDKATDTHTPQMVMINNVPAMTSCFLKITVVSGLCYKQCSEANSPLGVNYPGSTIQYTTTKTDGSTQRSTGTQMSQTAHHSLQTPYQIFGLGKTPNFLDFLQVGQPQRHLAEPRVHKWPFIIPNSQLIVIPHPVDKSASWLLKLYITPSQLVYWTGAALLGTCGFVGGIVLILQWREKREDKVEKQQESQRFHFDAM